MSIKVQSRKNIIKKSRSSLSSDSFSQAKQLKAVKDSFSKSLTKETKYTFSDIFAGIIFGIFFFGVLAGAMWLGWFAYENWSSDRFTSYFCIGGAILLLLIDIGFIYVARIDTSGFEDDADNSRIASTLLTGATFLTARNIMNSFDNQINRSNNFNGF